MEGVTWVCVDALKDHEWVSELNISIQATGFGGSQLRHRSSQRRPVENAVGFRRLQDLITDFQTTAQESRNTTIAHAKNVSVDISRCGFVQITRE